MKIVFVTFLYEPELGGGAAQVVHSLAKDLATQGNEITVITSARVPKAVIEHKNGIKIIRFYPKNLYWIVEKEIQPSYRKILWQLIDIWNPWVYRAMTDFLKVEQPHLVHVHKLRGLSSSVWDAAKAAGVTVLAHTCHDYELFSPEGLLRGRIGRMAEQRAIVMRPYQTLRAKGSSRVTLASAPSQYILGIHQKMGFFRNANRCCVIPNSHGFQLNDLLKLRTQNSRSQEKTLRLLYLGRLVPEKGVDILCQAVVDLSNSQIKVVLEIVGWGYYEKKLFERYGNYPNIHFRGAMFGEEKYQYLRNCDLLVLPSLVPESFGMVIAEAYAFGKPVIASRIGAIPELVREGETGFLVEPGSCQELAQTIKAISETPKILKSMTDACFETATQFASDIVLQKYRDFYHEGLRL